ncbi:MAG: hypothetical protein ACJ8KU_05105 [Chthoniobacterales bacterium]
MKRQSSSIRGGTSVLLAVELLLVCASVLATRCANYRDVFIGHEIYFTDADCYARMTRARICFEHPGTIVRRHAFENYPDGISPHTTAPLDYLIVAVAEAIRPFSSNPLDLAGATVSPFLALAGGVFLWWWARWLVLPFRPALLFIYAASPLLSHSSELGRPDHQSFVVFLVLVAMCSELSLQRIPSRAWGIAAGAAWGIALWVSLYEPLLLLAVVLVSYAIASRQNFTALHRRAGWLVMFCILVVAFAIEQRLPHWGGIDRQVFLRWAATVGELRHVPLVSRAWLDWCGYLVIGAPVLLAIGYRKQKTSPTLIALAMVSFCLTIWQVRWGYFFVLFFALLTPTILAAFNRRAVAALAFVVAIMPILSAWDETLWPGEATRALRIERRVELPQLRAAAALLSGQQPGAVLAPWWLSPAISYWSRHEMVAGSSHESLTGTLDSARFFVSSDPELAKAILQRRKVRWVLAYDAGRTVLNSAAILGLHAPEKPLASVLDRTPSSAPPFLAPFYQNAACKLFKVETIR